MYSRKSSISPMTVLVSRCYTRGSPNCIPTEVNV